MRLAIPRLLNRYWVLRLQKFLLNGYFRDEDDDLKDEGILQNIVSTQKEGTGEDFYAIAELDSLEIVVVGTNGTILHTSDGGESWQSQNSGTNKN